MKRVALLLIFVAGLLKLSAQEPIRPVSSAYMIEAGSSQLADTYLSPMKYGGWSAALAYERMQAMRFDPENWVMQLAIRGEVDRALNNLGNVATWRANISARWAMMHRWRQLAPGLTLAVGGATGIEGGCFYNTRNGNNPASAKAAWTIDATAFAAYNFRLGKLPLTLRYQAVLPVIGVFFSPQYDELYYEIYLGNHSGLAHCAWFGSRFAMTNLLTVDMHFGATSLRMGYRNEILSSKVANIVTRATTHAFVLGIAHEWLSLPRRTAPSTDARIISALY